MKIEKNEIRSTAHSKYRCQYHIVFAPKYRRKEIYGKLKRDIGEILRKLCEHKGVEIIEVEACPDHIHMLVSIPPHIREGYFGAILLSCDSPAVIYTNRSAIAITSHTRTMRMTDGVFNAVKIRLG